MDNVCHDVFYHFSHHFKARSNVRPEMDDLHFCTLYYSDSYKSLGAAGINFGFIKEFWDVLKDFMRFLSEFHRNARLTKGINCTFIGLIPKKISLQRLINFRLISLVGSLYKVLSKLLANRLRKVIETVISNSQSTFIRGLHILFDILGSNEVVYEARKRKKGVAAI